ncbi:MAG: aldehyde ferredoxin oxidoreductase family protein [Deltaproteobacteria bacterium]|nr:aldehyde ferredoxin oxidoreductase family protein [Deltaproteobacteria bacterium]
MKDFCLRGLFIDITHKKVRIETLPSDVSRKYLGGRGIGVYLLSKAPTASPLDINAPLVFSTGALTGSKIPASGRMMVSAFSPLTNTISSCSVGGNLAIQMKRAAIDFIHIVGKAKKETIIKICDHDVIFDEIPSLGDMSLGDMFSRFSGFKGSIAAVGRAAIHGCLFASIMVDKSFAAGRGGLGLVMASKGLRAIMIRGSKRPIIHDRGKETKARKDIIRLFDASPAIMGRSGIKRYGTPALVDLIASRRMMPTANFQKTYFNEYKAFSASNIIRSLAVKHHGCYACPIGCKQIGPHHTQIPEYETLSHFGALNENASLASIIQANSICNDAGLDTITAGATISCLAEIRGERYQGKDFVDKVVAMASGKGEGELLQLGSARLAEELKVPEASMSVKSLEMPAYDPRGAYGMALAYCTSTRGACHLRAYPISHEILRKPVAIDRFSFSGKARIIKIAEDLNAVIDSIGACKFAFFGASLEEYANAFSAVTALDYNTDDLLRLGDAIYTLERYINTKRGFTSKDDLLPERFFIQPGTSGPGIEIPPIDRVMFEDTLQRYYKIRGCTPDSILRQDRLKELGIV